MTIIDVIIVLLFITALLRGAERGLIRQFFGGVGLLVGFFIGALLQGKLIHFADSPADKAILSLVIIGSCIIILAAVGEYVGALIKLRADAFEHKGLDNADKGLGSFVGGLTLLLIVWLAAAIFASAPLPGLQRQINNSVIIAQLDQSLPDAPKVFAQLGHLIDPNGFPKVFTGLEPDIDLDTPLPSLGRLDVAVQAARASTVKIEGEGCGGVSDGSGFVADENLVITNAHVIAGVKDPSVIDANGRHQATVLWFDPNLDVAVLRTSELAGDPLTIASDPVSRNTPAAVLGYPGGGDFAARAAIVLDVFNAQGRNIYNEGTTERQVYSLRADIVPGNSGGPLVNTDGAVIGLIFAESATYDEVGYALTMDAVIAGLNKAKDQNKAVATGTCTR